MKSTLLNFLKGLSAENPHRVTRWTRQEVDELVDEWSPEPLGAPLTPDEQTYLASIPVVAGEVENLLSRVGKFLPGSICTKNNFTGLPGNETIKMRAIETPEIWYRWLWPSWLLRNFWCITAVHFPSP